MAEDVRLFPLLSTDDPQLFARVTEDAASNVVMQDVSGTDAFLYPEQVIFPSSPPSPPPPSTGPGFGLTAGMRVLAQRIGVKSGKSYWKLHNGCPDDVAWEAGTRLLMQRAGVKSAVPWGVIGTGPCGEDGKPMVGERYKAIRVGTKDGKPYYLVFCATCGDSGDPMGCGDCSICCTLDGTLELGDGGTGYSAGVDFTLTCGGSFTAHTSVSCLNNEVEDDTYCYEITTTYTGGSGFNVPYDFGGGVTGEYDWVTEVWVSDSFTAGGMTLKVWLVATQYTVRQATPTVSNFNQCANSWGIQYFQEAVEFDCCADRWVAAYTYVAGGGVGFAGVKVNSSSDAPVSPCIEGYSENGGGACGGFNLCNTPGGMIAQPFSTEDGLICDGDPFLILFEHMYCTASGGVCVSGDSSTYTKCFRITIADNCE